MYLDATRTDVTCSRCRGGPLASAPAPTLARGPPRGLRMGAILLLEDGRSFVGDAFGAVTTRVGEAVFNTAMSGYQEVLTDPSYAEQVVTMTAPHIGNTGINAEDPESERVWPAGFVVRRLTRGPSSWRSSGGLHQYLVQHGVPGMQ